MSYRHLTQEERYQIAALLSAGLSNVAIARQLGRHPSTIGRERRRNTGERSYRVSPAKPPIPLSCKDTPRVPDDTTSQF